MFKLDRAGIVDIAVKGAELIKKLADERPETDWIFQYSPESFTGTELDFAVEICDAVTAVWRPTPARKTILNLPPLSRWRHPTSTPTRSKGSRGMSRAVTASSSAFTA